MKIQIPSGGGSGMHTIVYTRVRQLVGRREKQRISAYDFRILAAILGLFALGLKALS